MLDLFRKWYERHFSDPQIVILGVFLVAGFFLIFFFGEILAPVLAAIVIAYLLDGMVGWLEKLKVPRMVAFSLVYVLFIACLLVVIIGLLPLLSQQIVQLLQDLPTIIARGQKLMMLLPERYPELITQVQIQQFIDFLSTGLTGMGERILSLSLASVRGLITAMVYIILVPLMVFFFLKDKHLIMAWLKKFLPENRMLASSVWSEVNSQVANYVRGKIWEVLIIWAITYVTFSFLSLRFSVLLSLFVGLSVLVPYIGVTFMFLPVGMIGFAQFGLGAQFLYVMTAYSVIQLFDGNLLAPLLLSEVVDLHPLAIIVAVLMFGGLWGVWGLFFAIPLATLVHAVIKAFAIGGSRTRASGNDPQPSAV